MGNRLRLFSPAQAAAICGVGFRTVARWLRRGQLVAENSVGGEILVSADSLLKLLAKKSICAPSALRAQTAPRALILEDDRPMANAIERTLIPLGFETAVAGNPLDAIQKLNEFKPHLISLDLTLGEISGNEFLGSIRNAVKSGAFKVIVISGGSDYEIMRALALGAHGFVKKPFRPEQLAFVAKELIELAA